MNIPTIKAIKPGYARTGFAKNERGYAVILFESKNCATPGTTIEERIGDLTPVVALEMTDAEQAHNIGTAILLTAERIRADEERCAAGERKEGDEE